MKKKFFLAGAILVMSAAAVVGYKVYNQSRMSAFMKANIEALSFYESRNCPEPYDVYNHQLHYDTRQGMFYVDGQGDVNILGKKIRVGGVYIGANVKIDYIIYHCLTPSESNCCPASKIGEIEVVNVMK